MPHHGAVERVGTLARRHVLVLQALGRLAPLLLRKASFTPYMGRASFICSLTFRVDFADKGDELMTKSEKCHELMLYLQLPRRPAARVEPHQLTWTLCFRQRTSSGPGGLLDKCPTSDLKGCEPRATETVANEPALTESADIPATAQGHQLGRTPGASTVPGRTGRSARHSCYRQAKRQGRRPQRRCGCTSLRTPGWQDRRQSRRG
jgi:hypothetical protein